MNAGLHKSTLSEQEFWKLSDFIKYNYGIKLPVTKKIMLESRLRNRLKATGCQTFSEYLRYLFSEEGMKSEVVHMVDVVSTNKTDFYREPAHFNYLTAQVLPALQKEQRLSNIKIWCAATSTGEEPYTLAITLEEYKSQHGGPDYSLFCTDISTRVLDSALMGVYDQERISEVPAHLKSRYFLRSKDRTSNKVRVVPELRKKLSFKRFNLIDDSYDTPGKFEIIFCRNVLIYFERKVQEEVVNKLCSKLIPGGYLFLGHSESVAGFNVPLKTLQTSIYKKIL